MSFLTTDYSNTTNNSNEPLPAGDYEFIINSVQENATNSGAESVQFDLIVRNDLDAALPETNGKQHNRHLWVNEWKRRKTNQYDLNNFMYFMKAAGIPEGTEINSIEDFFQIMNKKPVRIHIKVTTSEYNGQKRKENRPAPWDWEKTQFPNVQHHFKSENKPENNPQPTVPTTDTAVDDESLPF